MNAKLLLFDTIVVAGSGALSAQKACNLIWLVGV